MPLERTASSYRDRVLSKIRRYTSDDLDEVLAFRAAMYGPDSFLAQPGYMRWMFERSAALGGVPAAQWLFHSNGALEGQQAGIRVPLRIGDREHAALWATDFFVSPAFQLRGIGAVLTEVVTAETPVTMGVEVSDAARRAFVRAGWSDLGEVPLYARPIDLSAAHTASHRVPHPLVAPLDTALRLAERAAAAFVRSRRLRLAEVSRFDERSDAIWRECAPQFAVIARRDAGALNWRYVEFPRERFYRCYYLLDSGKAVGYAVLRIGDHQGVRSGHIVDFLCPPDGTFALLTECAHVLRRDGAQTVYCMQQSPLLGHSFTAAGFVRRSTGWPLMVLAGGLCAHDREIVTNPASWYLTSGDSNIDHPREGVVYAS